MAEDTATRMTETTAAATLASFVETGAGRAREKIIGQLNQQGKKELAQKLAEQPHSLEVVAGINTPTREQLLELAETNLKDAPDLQTETKIAIDLIYDAIEGTLDPNNMTDKQLNLVEGLLIGDPYLRVVYEGLDENAKKSLILGILRDANTVRELKKLLQNRDLVQQLVLPSEEEGRLEQEVANLQEKAESLNEKAKKLEATIEQIESEISTLLETEVNINNKKGKLKDNLVSLENLAQKRQRLLQQLEIYRERLRVARSTEALETLTSKIEEIESNINSLNEQLQLYDQYVNLVQNKEDYEKEKNNLMKEKGETSLQLKEKEAKLQRLKKEREKLQRTFADQFRNIIVEAAADTLSQRIKEIAKKEAELLEEQERKETQQAQNKALRTARQKLDEQLRTKKGEINWDGAKELYQLLLSEGPEAAIESLFSDNTDGFNHLRNSGEYENFKKDFIERILRLRMLQPGTFGFGRKGLSEQEIVSIVDLLGEKTVRDMLTKRENIDKLIKEAAGKNALDFKGSIKLQLKEMAKKSPKIALLILLIILGLGFVWTRNV